MSDDTENGSTINEDIASHPCEGVVWAGRFSHQYPCGKRSKIFFNGGYFCGTHDPVAKRAKEEQRHAKWKREDDILRASQALRSARYEAADLIEACVDGTLKPIEVLAARENVLRARQALADLEREP